MGKDALVLAPEDGGCAFSDTMEGLVILRLCVGALGSRLPAVLAVDIIGKSCNVTNNYSRSKICSQVSSKQVVAINESLLLRSLFRSLYCWSLKSCGMLVHRVITELKHYSSNQNLITPWGFGVLGFSLG